MLALTAVRRLGGDRLRLVAAGAAVVPESLLAFLRDCFGVGGPGGGQSLVSNGYAMTEVPGGIARDGVPVPGVEVKIAARGQREQGGEGGGEGGGEILVKTSRGLILGVASDYYHIWTYVL